MYLLKDNVTYTNEDLKFILIDKRVPDFIDVSPVQDVVPFSRRKITYERRDKHRTIQIIIQPDAKNSAELSECIFKLNELFCGPIFISFPDIGFVFEVMIKGPIRQKNLFKHLENEHLKHYTINFETTTPYKYSPQRSNEVLTMGSLNTFGMNLALDHEPTIFNDIVAPVMLSLKNYGNQSALPIINISGTATDLCIGHMKYNGELSGRITIDCDLEECFNSEDVDDNRLMYLSSNKNEFLEIDPGCNEIAISGSNLDVNIEFVYRHTYR